MNAVQLLHQATAVAGFTAATAALLLGLAQGWRARVGHGVMLLAMALPVLGLLGRPAPVVVLLLVVVAAWVTAWTTAAAERTAPRRSLAPLELCATAGLLLLMPTVTPGAAAVPVTGAHAHAGGAAGSAVPLLALVICTVWLVAGVLRARTDGAPACPGRNRGGTVCSIGMAVSMGAMALAHL